MFLAKQPRMFGKTTSRAISIFHFPSSIFHFCLVFCVVALNCKADKWWSFTPPTRPEIPAAQNAKWPKNEIDHFILQKLEQKNLKPAKQADKRTLIRRATFDLTGLPPTPQEVDAFIKDTSTNAFAKVIDRLLASPHYGERWGRHWLDVVRYTDAQDSRDVGGQSDVAEAWRYRDWVTRAFNDDLPYNKFIEQQIAGDLLPVDPPAEINTNAIIATGMYAIGNWGNGDADKDKILTDIADDQVDVTSKAFLGVTLACARCHDHKFDPLTQRDYYAMAGIFFSSHILPKLTPKGQGENILRIPLISDAEAKRRKAREERVTKVEQQIEDLIDTELKSQSEKLLPHVAEYLSFVVPSGVRDGYASNKLDAHVLNLWRSYLGLSDLRLLSKYVPNLLDKPGLHALRNAANDDTPSAVANTTSEEIQFLTIKMPPHSLAIHPPPSGAVAVAWKCPTTGKFTIKGHVTDADPNCGDGIAWKLSIRGKTEPLESGMISNGGEQPIHELTDVTINARDFLELQILPKGEYSCDTTLIEFEISEYGDPSLGGRVWKLQSDVLSDFASNPHADNYGNTSVWHFYDLSTKPADPVTRGSLLSKWRASTNHTEKAKLATELQQSLATKTNAAITNLYADLTNPRSIFWNPARSDTSAFSKQTRDQLTALRTEADSLRKTTLPQIEMANALQEGGVPESPHAGVHDVKLHIRGRYDRLGDTVPRGFPKILSEAHPTITNGSGRLELARWIASEKNPLTARVIVNRIWQHHFGEGLVRTPNNFGKLGTPPTHPELLDYLATEFVKNGWSIKTMHRAMMLSATYQQSSIPERATQKADPDNLLFGHMNRQRLESELIRDSLLSATGELDPALFGKSIRDLNTKRRTLYVMTIRSDRATYQSLFDCADPNVSVEKRLNSTVAPQSLFLLNNAFTVERSKQLATRALREIPKSDRQRIKWLYELLYARPATTAEIKLGSDSMRSFSPSLPRSGGEGRGEEEQLKWQQYCQVLLCANEFIYID
jgi:hypothetical protein